MCYNCTLLQPSLFSPTLIFGSMEIFVITSCNMHWEDYCGWTSLHLGLDFKVLRRLQYTIQERFGFSICWCSFWNWDELPAPNSLIYTSMCWDGWWGYRQTGPDLIVDVSGWLKYHLEWGLDLMAPWMCAQRQLWNIAQSFSACVYWYGATP